MALRDLADRSAVLAAIAEQFGAAGMSLSPSDPSRVLYAANRERVSRLGRVTIEWAKPPVWLTRRREPRRRQLRRLAHIVLVVITGGLVAGCGAAAPACTHQTQPTRIDSVEQGIDTTTPNEALAKQYEPTVKISILDRFWPVSVQSVLEERTWLGGTVSLVSRNDTYDRPMLAELKTSDSTKSYLDYPASLTDKAAQMRVFLRGIGVPDSKIYAWPTNLTTYAQESAQIYFYDGGTNCSFAGHSMPGYRALEYWFFYPLNYYPLTVNTSQMLAHPLQADSADIDFHEGDWEHVTVLLAPGNVPNYVWMARHSSEGTLIPWHQVQKDSAGHPIVYSAFGGHPSYPGCGAHPRSLLAASVYDYVICGPGLYTFYGNDTKLVDLGHVSWSCWPGHFGTTVGTKDSSNADDPTGAILVAGPGTPLRQGENRDACPRATG